MITIPSDAIYLDMSVNIGVSIDDTVFDHASVRQMVMYVIGTRKGSRKWRPKFGSYVASYLFDPFDDTTANWISTYARLALEDPYNGLVDTITDVGVLTQMAEGQTYLCTIAYTIPAINRREEVRFAMRYQG